VELRWLGPGDLDDVVAAEHLFDGPVVLEAARRFLEEPDKGTELFLYELGVDERWRRRGIGTALVRALAVRARERGCYGMWVLTDRPNEAAVATYLAAGAADEGDQVMFGWSLR
jgi:ribosomal protein S18 acetylase RimI-like enzyme